MSNFTIPNSQADFLNLKTGKVSRDWFIYLNNLLNAVGQGIIGTGTQVLHGGGAGYSQVSLQGDVTGVLPSINGGTGVANIAKTITLGGNLSIGGNVFFSGASTATINIPSNVNVTLSSSGTLLTSVTLVGDVIGTSLGNTVTTSIAIGGQLPATTTANSASSGNLGEYQFSTVTSGQAISLISTSVRNITSIILTGGDWDVTGQVDYTANGATIIQYMQQGSNSVSGTLPSQDGFSSTLLGATVATDPGNPIPVSRFSLATSTSVYLITKTSFSINTLSAYGTLRARRVR